MSIDRAARFLGLVAFALALQACEEARVTCRYERIDRWCGGSDLVREDDILESECDPEFLSTEYEPVTQATVIPERCDDPVFDCIVTEDDIAPPIYDPNFSATLENGETFTDLSADPCIRCELGEIAYWDCGAC